VLRGYKSGEEHVARWSLSDIEWQQFDPSRIDPNILAVVKAASLVERNAHEYGRYLESVFRDDPEFVKAAWQWVGEEVQHGMALGRWAQMADPTFDFEGAFARFRAEITLPTQATESIRGSRVGEFVARCMVETGTSSMYTALAQATEEPVLKQIAKNIASDEFRHYKLFYTHGKRYAEREQVNLLQRARVAWKRAAETEDDELAFAFYAANHAQDGPYDKKRYKRLYAYRAYNLYRYSHIERVVTMTFKAVGLKPHSLFTRIAATATFAFVRWRVARLGAKEARLEVQPA
jgi:hypothetical protein